MYMPNSPAGRPITYLFGDADKIKSRGTEIESLGQMMLDSASALQGLVDGTDGNKGKAVDKLREGVGDVHGTLKEAGELYKPTGPIVHTYGIALAREQESIEGHVNRCQTLWETFAGLPGSVDPRGSGGPFQPDEGSDEAEQNAQEDAAKLAAYNDWEAEAKLYDGDYDDWESAFDKAAGSIDNTLAGKIKDSFWDDVDGFVAGVLKVLAVVGIIVAIAALVIGGPIVAIIGGVIAAITLALTIYQFARGDAGKLDLALAIVGVIPIGKLGKLFQGKAGLKTFASEFAGGAFKPSTWSAASTQLRGMQSAFAGADDAFRGSTSAFKSLWNANNPNGMGDVFSRIMTGKDVKGWKEFSDDLDALAPHIGIPSALFEFHRDMGAQVLSMDDLISNFTGHEPIKERFPKVGLVL